MTGNEDKIVDTNVLLNQHEFALVLRNNTFTSNKNTQRVLHKQ